MRISHIHTHHAEFFELIKIILIFVPFIFSRLFVLGNALRQPQSVAVIKTTLLKKKKHKKVTNAFARQEKGFLT